MAPSCVFQRSSMLPTVFLNVHCACAAHVNRLLAERVDQPRRQTELCTAVYRNHLRAGISITLTPVRMCSSIHMARVFVYGTLKKGQPNYYRMFKSTNGKAEFLASARTTQKYPLVITTEYNIPFLLNLPGQGHLVQGEIYKVDDKMLKYLDALESVPTMYQRVLVKLEVMEWAGEAEGGERPAAGSITEAFVYNTTTYEPDWPSLPCYESYDSYGEHGLDYVTREARDRCHVPE